MFLAVTVGACFPTGHPTCGYLLEDIPDNRTSWLSPPYAFVLDVRVIDECTNEPVEGVEVEILSGWEGLRLTLPRLALESDHTATRLITFTDEHGRAPVAAVVEYLPVDEAGTVGEASILLDIGMDMLVVTVGPWP